MMNPELTIIYVIHQSMYAYHMEGLFLFLEFDLLFNDLTIWANVLRLFFSILIFIWIVLGKKLP